MSHGAEFDERAALRERATEALAELTALRSDDPAAHQAIHAVRLAAHTIERFWLPSLD